MSGPMIVPSCACLARPAVADPREPLHVPRCARLAALLAKYRPGTSS
jgi:hypothetical protein